MQLNSTCFFCLVNWDVLRVLRIVYVFKSLHEEPAMSDLMDILNDLIVDHWAKLLVGLLIFGAGRWWGQVRSRREWERKDFRNRVTVSLNSIQNGKLMIRTVLEKEAHEIFINDAAVSTLLKAASETNESDPIIHFGKKDRWHLLNAVLNEIAENFGQGLFARDMSLPVAEKRYLFCMTREVDGDMRARKIRVMMIQPEFLESEDCDFAELEVEHPHHATRLKTLAIMRRAWHKDNEDFMALEITMKK